MAIRVDHVAVTLPGLRAFRWSTDEPHTGVKETYAIARTESGRSSWRSGGRTWAREPGSLQILQPGDVCRDLSRDGPSTIQVVTVPAHVVEQVTGTIRVCPHIDAGDPRGAPFHRLRDAVFARGDRLTLEALLTEAVETLGGTSSAKYAPTRALRRAIEMLRTASPNR